MKLNLHYVILIFYFFAFQFSEAQQENKKCLCELLEQSEANDKKVIELATEIEESFHNLSQEGFQKHFDSQSFMESILSGTGADTNDSFTRGFIEGVGDTSKKLGLKILNEINNGAYYNLVNYHYDVPEKAYYFSFRLYSEETGINYHDYKVCSDGENINVNDIYIYLSGEHISETIKRIFKISLSEKDNDSIDPEDSTINGVFQVLNARKLAESGKPKEAFEKLNKIKGPLVEEKYFLLIKILFAASVNDEIYEDTIAEFAKLYPEDPTLYIKLIDYYILKENYKLVQENLDKLIFETEDDFLNLIKAHIYLIQEDYVNAEKYFNYIKENYPEIFDAYIGEMVSLTYQEKFKKAIEIAQVLVDEGYDKQELMKFFEEKEPDGTNQLEALITSDEYKKWEKKS
ncbi:hypothetical protein FBALC1_05493 [Flavobacteriales bacterium ALC-1]|nr:hypothetical protein FBALC1_05493 [Flavobacteriales bacterium ALC-1]